MRWAKGYFYFLPFFLAYTAANKFGGKPFISMAIAATVLYPDILSAVTGKEHNDFCSITFGFLEIIAAVFFQLSLLQGWVASLIEKRLRKIIPDILKMIFVPMCTIIIIVPLTLLVLGPILTYAMDSVTYVINVFI